MNHKQRFKNAILLKETDRMPHTEQMIHDALVAQIVHEDLPGDDDNALFKWMNTKMTDKNFKRHIQARNFLGFDHVQVFPMEGYEKVGVSEHGNELVRDIWGAVLELTDESTIIIQKPITSIDQIENYCFPDVDAFGFDNIKRWIEQGDFFVAAQIDTGYFKVHQLVGFEEYMEYIYTEPEKMHTLLNKFTEFQMKLADKLIEMGVDGIWLSDDHAYNAGPFISPEKLQEFDFDYMKKVVAHIHSKQIPVVLHSCGNLNKTIQQLVETGIDALHAIQPSADNDIYEYKKKFGNRICLIGNLDINYLLPEGSPMEILDKVKEMAQHMYYDKKGFILSTCNLLNIDIPIENAITMHLSAESIE